MKKKLTLFCGVFIILNSGIAGDIINTVSGSDNFNISSPRDTIQVELQSEINILNVQNRKIFENWPNYFSVSNAFTKINMREINDRLTIQDIPHTFVNIPGVYVTSFGGSGLGDSKLSIRGFD